MRFVFTTVFSVLGLLIGLVAFFDEWSFASFVFMSLFSMFMGFVFGFAVDSARLARKTHAFIAFSIFMIGTLFVVYSNSVFVEWGCIRGNVQENPFTGECKSGCFHPWYWVPAGDECLAKIEEQERGKLEFVQFICAQQGYDDITTCPFWNG